MNVLIGIVITILFIVYTFLVFIAGGVWSIKKALIGDIDLSEYENLKKGSERYDQ